MRDPILSQPQYRTLRDQVTAMLREAIISGRFKPGERLLEAEIAAHMNLSRSPIREALRELEKEGLVTSVPNKGTTVVQFTRDDVIQIYGIRLALEQLAVRWAAERMTPEDMAELTAIVDEMEAARRLAQPEGARTILALDIEFHRRLYRAARAEYLTRVLDGFINHIRMLMALTGRRDTDAGTESLVQEHREILDHIAAGDVERAVQHMAMHVRAAEQRILKRLDARDAFRP